MIFRWVKLQELSYKGTVRNSDLIYVLGRGSLLESGNHAQLFSWIKAAKDVFSVKIPKL